MILKNLKNPELTKAMLTNIKWIVIVLFLLACVALFIWGDRFQPGSIFAGLAGFIAALKSKFFVNVRGLDKMALIKQAHELKLEEWKMEKLEYEQPYDSLKNRIDSLNKRIELFNKELEKTSKPGYRAKKRSEEEILRWLNR